MSTESEAQPGSPEFSEQGIADLLPKIVDVKNLLPSEKKVNLEERQETTRSQLATFLIYILAGTLTASFALIISLTIMSAFVDEKKAQSFEKTSSLVKDLITFILTAQTGLIGTALGFYFGSKGNNTD